MKSIKILDPKTAGKIAAGEVIERPSGVLKELIENSLDSGASIINIDIEKAGKKLIRVNDNGRGIPADELSSALLRHSTSKIENFEDLETLNTFGFRGEALYSIAAISRLSLISCIAGGKGAMIQTEGGKIVNQAPAPAIQGTTAEVRDLFFNTPARLKFLKSDAVERSHLLACAEEAAMANPEVVFNIRTDGSKIYSLNAQKEDESGLRNRLGKILGEDIVNDMLYIQDETFSFKAFVSPADKLYPARDRQFFFVNKRPVTCKLLQQALYKAYQPYREKDKHPSAVIFMTLPPNEFDVNIHPQKKDIKFAQEREVFNFVCSKTEQALLQNARSQNIELNAKEQPAAPVFPCPPAPSFSAKTDFKQQAQNLGQLLNSATPKTFPTVQARDFEAPPTYNFGNETAPEDDSSARQTPAARADGQPSLLQENQSGQPLWFKGPYTYIGQLQQSYLLFENPQGLVMIDQHAAQERIYFEEYMSEIENSSVQIQPLMFPVSLQLPASKLEAVLSWAEPLNKAGFEISRFSSGTLTINSVPNLLKFKEDSIKDFILSLSEVIGDPAKSDNALKYKLISTIACKKAVKAGEKLEREQAEALLNNMKKCKDALHCPHGRPTLITLEMKEITRKFGRS